MSTLPVRRPLQPVGPAPAAQTTPGRTLAGYLLLPRPSDLTKAVVAPLTFALGALAHGGVTASQLWRAAVAWIILELFVYQARYQWNDVRGFAADQQHPDAAARGRLPGSSDRARPHIEASVAVTVLRLLVAAAVALAIPELRVVILAMTVGVFGVAFVYERVRSLAARLPTEVPVPLRPSLVAVWIAVGAGYAVRGLTGLALAVPLRERPGLVVAAALALWAIGVAFVTCRWALEAICFASFDDRRVVWHAGRAKARQHTLGLVRWLPSVATHADPTQWRALHGRTPLAAPWHLALVVAAGAAAVTGRFLVHDANNARALLFAAVAVAVAVAVAITRLPGHRGVAAAVAALVLVGVQRLAGLDDSAVATLPWLAVMVAYACFTRQCACEIGRPLRRR